MKIIDKFLIKSFIPPFIVSFGIALFVLVMQILWVYIDEIMGKGLGIFELTELIFYLSMTLVPTALPIAVLISTVMVTGNLAERYELSSLKSAGIGLVRTLRPLFLAVATISLFSIFVSELVIPWANLKFYSRFYDIRKAKPTLSLQEGIFNDEFQDYTLRIGKKGADDKSLEDVMIYNNRSANQQINQSIAKKGEMFNSADNQYIIMNLFDGIQFQETGGNQSGKQTYPFVRIKFKKWQKIFDMSEFDRQKTDEGLFKNHHKMKNSRQLYHFADSVREEGKRYIDEMKVAVGHEFTPQRSRMKAAPSSAGLSATIDTSATEQTAIQKDKNKINNQLDSLSRVNLAGTPYEKPKEISQGDTQSVKKLPRYYYDLDTILKPYEKNINLTTAEEKARIIQNAAENAINNLKMVNESAGRFIYEMNMKYNYAIICLVFLFIGAPMGAIIQKGGFGMPILVAIVFFMVYMVSIIYCKNLRESRDLGFIMAAWLPVLIMVPFAIVLTYRALNDYRMINFDPSKYWHNLTTFFSRKRK